MFADRVVPWQWARAGTVVREVDLDRHCGFVDPVAGA